MWFRISEELILCSLTQVSDQLLVVVKIVLIEQSDLLLLSPLNVVVRKDQVPREHSEHRHSLVF